MFGRKRPASDFHAEIEAHLQLEIERLQEEGLNEEEARAAAHCAVGPSTVVSADFPAWKDRNNVFEEIAAFGGTSGANLTGTGQPARVTVTSVTTGLFSMLGVQPVAGRAFLAEEGKQGRE